MAPSPAPLVRSEPDILLDREQPFFFRVGATPLYAVLHGAAAPRDTVLVHVHSLGVEQLTNYRNAVNLARAAAATGIPALRWHARGHGDSGGDYADVTLDTLADDAAAAAAIARDRTGATRVVWWADRFGALPAARALARDPARAAGLVLWEPVQRASDHFRGVLRGMLYSAVAHGRKPDATVDQLLERVAAVGAVDVLGYLLHRAIVDSARDVTLERELAAWSGPTLLAQVQARPRLSPAHAALMKTLETRGARAATAFVNEEPGWQFISNPAWESAPLIAGTMEWLRGVA
ncbi:MAG TPA: alpha/beta hydrolase [Candidatus Eisenbacteria bacterium]|nr:alpha/beta hydrolase [Candidatus Eisenbacteria bacterium]